MKTVAKVISTFFGIGYFPLAPGTLISLAAVLVYKFFLFRLSTVYFLVMLVFIFFIGVWASSIVSQVSQKDDPRFIVIDETLGQLLILFKLNPQWPLLLAAFFFFRVFDIIKPFPIKKVENFPAGWGIMLDDLVAALYGGILINIYLLLQ
ncbi:MAG: phosphatidylglycerophosphatase A [Acidobacteriota bacterium]